MHILYFEFFDVSNFFLSPSCLIYPGSTVFKVFPTFFQPNIMAFALALFQLKKILCRLVGSRETCPFYFII